MFFSVIAMFVLAGEVYYYKRRATLKKPKIQTSDLKVVPFTTTFGSKIQPIDYLKDGRKNNTILLGHGNFIPVTASKSRLSYFSGNLNQSRY